MILSRDGGTLVYSEMGHVVHVRHVGLGFCAGSFEPTLTAKWREGGYGDPNEHIVALTMDE